MKVKHVILNDSRDKSTYSWTLEYFEREDGDKNINLYCNGVFVFVAFPDGTYITHHEILQDLGLKKL